MALLRQRATTRAIWRGTIWMLEAESDICGGLVALVRARLVAWFAIPSLDCSGRQHRIPVSSFFDGDAQPGSSAIPAPAMFAEPGMARFLSMLSHNVTTHVLSAFMFSTS